MNKKKALGRGLSALFENNESNKEKQNPSPDKTTLNQKEKNTEKRDFQLISLKEIRPNSKQPRSFFDEEKLSELAQSIKQYGIIEPIIISNKISSAKSAYYEIIAGERRVRAAKLAGLKQIPAVIKTVDNEDLLEIMLIENLQREDLTVLEEVESYAAIIEKNNLTQDQLAEKIGKSRSYITNMMRILKAPLAVKKLLAENKLNASQVRTIINIPEEQMIHLAQRIMTENINVRKLEKLVKEIQNKSANVTKSSLTNKNKKSKKDPNIAEIEELYRNKLKTKVSIIPIKKKLGKIEIEYYHYDELLEILSRISGTDE